MPSGLPGATIDMPSPVTLIEGRWSAITPCFSRLTPDGILNYPGGQIIYDTLELTVLE